MTEAEWLTCSGSDVFHTASRMIKFIEERGSVRKLHLYRKLHLFTCGCFRCLRPPLTNDENVLQAVGLVEQFADGTAREGWVRAVERIAWWLAETHCVGDSEDPIYTVGSGGFDGANMNAANDNAQLVATAWRLGEEADKCDLIRDIFGNPFRPVAIDRCWLSWNSGTIPKLAKTIYADRAFDRLPILADALEEGGCTDTAILEHCHGPGPHVRGCWVVDLLLGKT